MVGGKPVTEVAEQTVAKAERPSRQELTDTARRLYAEHAEPLEAEHWGKFVAISPNGQTLVGDELEIVSREAAAAFGRGSFLFKIGEMAVGHIR